MTLTVATKRVNSIAEESLSVSFEVPSDWWCKWQALKGTNFSHITLASVNLSTKLVVLTGGNSGIGREAALQFARWGADIVLGCREPPPHEQHPSSVVEECLSAARAAGYEKSRIEWWKIDMAELDSVAAFGKRLLESNKPIDILANNAGMPGSSGEPRFTVDGFELLHQVVGLHLVPAGLLLITQVNFLSHVLLTMTVLPLLAKATAPRILCTTSCMQYFGIFNLTNANSGRNAYSNNKLYFQTWLTELQRRMSNHADFKHVAVHGVHPGYVKTNIWNTTPNEAKSTKKLSWLHWGLNALLNYVGIDPQQGSVCITNTATSPTWGLGPESPQKSKGKQMGGGRYANRIWDEAPMPQTKDDNCRRLIWQFLDAELGLGERGLLGELGA